MSENINLPNFPGDQRQCTFEYEIQRVQNKESTATKGDKDPTLQDNDTSYVLVCIST